MICPLCNLETPEGSEVCLTHGWIHTRKCVACDQDFQAVSNWHDHHCNPRILARRDANHSRQRAIDEGKTLDDRLRDAELLESWEEIEDE